MVMNELQRQGSLFLGFKDLNDKDVKRILLRLSSPPRERRPRKCQRLEGLSAISAKLPSKPVYKLNFVGNTRISNAGTRHLNLIPSSVVDLDLSDCGITAEGVKNICAFLKTNRSITRMIMWGNEVRDEGASYISEMLRANKTLRILCITGCSIGPKGFSHLAQGLQHNHTLSVIDLGSDADVGDVHVKNLCVGLEFNRGLKTLDLYLTSITEVGVGYLESVLHNNVHLETVALGCPILPLDEDFSTGPGTLHNKLQYWLMLNRMNRKLIKDEDAKLTEWRDAIIQSAEADNVDAVYFFLRTKPDLSILFTRD